MDDLTDQETAEVRLCQSLMLLFMQDIDTGAGQEDIFKGAQLLKKLYDADALGTRLQDPEYVKHIDEVRKRHGDRRAAAQGLTA